jgi:hypothetical protein
MAILRSDLPGLQKSSDALTELILGAKQKQDQMGLQKDLNVQQAKDMLPVEQQAAQQKSDIALKQSATEREGAKSMLGQLKDEGLITEGGGAAVTKDGLSVTRGINPLTMQNQQDKLMNSEAMGLNKLTKPIQDNADVLEQIRTIHEMAKNPNAYDQKNIGILQARIAEGKGQRLLQGVINTFGAKGESAPGWVASMSNKIQGKAASTITPEELQQLVEHTHKMGDEYVQRFQDSVNQYDQMAPMAANRTMQVDPSRIQRVRDSAAGRGFQSIDTINKSKQQYQDTAAAAGRQVPAPAAPQEQGLMSWLKGKLPGSSPQQAAPQAQPAMSYEEYKKRKAEGTL